MTVLDLLGQGDAVTRTVALALLALSLASWVVILWKTWFLHRASAGITRARAAFWAAPDWGQARAASAAFDHAALLLPLIAACAQPTQGSLAASATRAQQLTRALREALQSASDKLHFGQVLLATTGSISPFIGLLGTVWGIYHALASVANSGLVSIDKVAGPVGEALIMTAAGLAVAIPAVLAYNIFSKRVARLEADLEGFAHDLRALDPSS